ncbi:MAG TPA: signal recognition particle subunit SRP19/SEC65 family protein [Candidatus Binatus sp.]|nr:signal recognition particle subunit SRP19/SEC65 family protein [Candidatus Binatus sp.]
MKRPGRQIVWPSNIDNTKTRLQGRKVPLPKAVRQPSLRELVEAARILGLDPQPTEKMSKPNNTWDKSGYVDIKKTGSKILTLKGLASEVLKIRQRQATVQQPTIQAKRR